MAGRRRPHATSRRSGRRRVPLRVWWQQLRRRWNASCADVYQSLQSWT